MFSVCRVSFLLLISLISLKVFANEIVGKAEGVFSVSPDGSSSYSIPFKVAPGTAGMQPRISLTYSSNGRISEAGYGWQVSGLITITRGIPNWVDEGFVSNLKNDQRDAFFLNGEKLVRVGQKGEVVTFTTKNEQYSRIRAYGWNGRGPTRFEVETKSGRKLFIGSTVDSRYLARGTIQTWLIDREVDSVGNYQSYHYFKDGNLFYIGRIDYTGNVRNGNKPYASLNFEYKSTLVFDYSYVNGQLLRKRHRLANVTSKFKDTVYRKYELNHSTTAPGDQNNNGKRAFKLLSVKELGSDGKYYPETVFSYGKASPGWRSVSNNFSLPTELSNIESNQLVFLDVDNDGKEEIVYAASENANDFATYKFQNNKWEKQADWVFPVHLRSDSGPNNAIMLGDFNADGFIDVWLSNEDENRLWLNNATDGWNLSAQDIPYSALQYVEGEERKDLNFVWMDLDIQAKDGKELIWFSDSQQVIKGAGKATQAGWVELTELHPPISFEADKYGLKNAIAIDVDCSGTEELVYFVDDDVIRVFEATANSWTEILDTSFIPSFTKAPPLSYALRKIDIDKDGCSDLFVSFELDGEQHNEALIASVNGWNAYQGALPQTALVSQEPSGQYVPRLAIYDVNKDSIPDFINSKEAYLSGANGWTLQLSYSAPRELEISNANVANNFDFVTLDSPDKLGMFYKSGFNTESGQSGLFFVRKNNEWVINGDFLPPLEIATFDVADNGVRFPDLNGDGMADLAYTKREKNKAITDKDARIYCADSAYNQTPCKKTWEQDKRFIIPVPTFHKDLTDAGAILVDFNGDGLTDILSSTSNAGTIAVKAYINCSKMVVCSSVPIETESGFWLDVTDPRIAQYNYTRYLPPKPFVDDSFTSAGIKALDVDADGLTDLLYSKTTKDNPNEVVSEVYLNRPLQGGWLKHSGYSQLPVEFVRPIFTEVGEQDLPFSKTQNNRIEVVDLNNDRLPDLIYNLQTIRHSPSNTPTKQVVKGAYINTGHGWETADSFIPPYRLDHEEAHPNRKSYLQDVNGDGLIDLIYAENKNNSGNNVTYLNSGSGWVRNCQAANGVGCYDLPISAIADSGSEQGFRFLDVNADGLIDVVYNHSDDRKGALINTGVNWKLNRDSNWSPPIRLFEKEIMDLGVRPFDFNADGIIDLVRSHKKSSDNTISQNYMNIPYDNNQKIDALISVVDGMSVATKISYGSLIALDVEDDGTQQSYSHGILGPQTLGNIIPLSTYPVVSPPLPGFVVTVTENRGFGISARSKRYRYGQYQFNVRKGESYGFGTQQVYDVEDSKLTEFSFYQIPGIVGSIECSRVFDTQSARNKVQSMTLVCNAPQNKSFPPVVDSEIALLKHSFTHWELFRCSASSCKKSDSSSLHYDTAGHSIQSRMKSSAVSSWDLHGLLEGYQSDQFNFDQFGNLLGIRTEFGNGEGTCSRNSYFDTLTEEKWFLGRMATAQVTKYPSEYAEQSCEEISKNLDSKSAEFSYDIETGQLISETSLVNTEFEVKTEYERDDFGNITLSKTTGADGKVRTNKLVFDDLGRFSVSFENQLGHTSHNKHNQVSGLVEESVDINGLSTRFIFDSLGNLKSTLNSDRTYVTRTIDYTANDPNGFYYILEEAVCVGANTFEVNDSDDCLPAATSFFNALGAIRRTEQISLNGKIVVQDYYYDILHRNFKTSLPYFKGETPKHIEKEFDYLSRVTRIERPSDINKQKDMTKISRKGFGEHTLTDLGMTVIGKLESVTNAKEHTSYAVKDLKGQTVKTIDAMGGVTEFVYDFYGNNTLIKNALGDEISAQFNLVGQRTKLKDPSLGTWTYKYDSFSNLLEQKDPNGYITELGYDSLDRLIYKQTGKNRNHYHYKENLSTDQYGCATEERVPNGVLIASSNPNASICLKYDELSRLTSKTVAIGHDEVNYGFVYDPFSRVKETHFSTGIVAVNSYSKEGVWDSVSVLSYSPEGIETKNQIWKLEQVSATGAIERELLMNGIVENQYSYFQNSERIKSFRSSQSNRRLLSWSNTYDVLGNVTKRMQDFHSGYSTDERFNSYDKLNRITDYVTYSSFSPDNAKKEQIRYDQLGNITSRKSVGNYNYCDNGLLKNLLCEISGGGDSGTKRITYDLAGNITRLGTKEISYYANGLVSSIKSQGNSSVHYKYGPGDELTEQLSYEGVNHFTTRYFGAVEIMREDFAPPYLPTAERTRVKHYVSTPGGTVGYHEQTYWHYPKKQSWNFNEISLRDLPKRTFQLTTSFKTFLKDHLGSIKVVLDENAVVVDELDFDIWGKRRGKDAGQYRNQSLGFTGHKHSDSVGMIHMNGRVYATELARFVSPDPFVQYAGHSQSYNRYAYVLNNPLSYVDPTGYFFKSIGRAFGNLVRGVGNAIKDVADAVIGKPLKWVGEQINKAGKWLSENWKTVAVIAATVALGPAGAGLGAWMVGAIAGGLNAALHGGSLSDVLRGAAFGAVSGFASGALGATSTSGMSDAFGSTFAQAHVGGVMSAAQGGDYLQGASSAMVGRFVSATVPDSAYQDYGLAVAAASGGLAAELSGGSFENGAITASFSYVFSNVAKQMKVPTLSDGSGGVAFVGGAMDDKTSVLRDHYDKFEGSKAYFTWDQGEALEQWIVENGGDVTIVAHSYGADTAATVVASGVRVTRLITVDPVSRLKPVYSKIKSNSGSWTNYNATGKESGFGNEIAIIGGKWGSKPPDTINVDYGHASICQHSDKYCSPH